MRLSVSSGPGAAFLGFSPAGTPDLLERMEQPAPALVPAQGHPVPGEAGSGHLSERLWKGMAPSPTDRTLSWVWGVLGLGGPLFGNHASHALTKPGPPLLCERGRILLSILQDSHENISNFLAVIHNQLFLSHRLDLMYSNVETVPSD